MLTIHFSRFKCTVLQKKDFIRESGIEINIENDHETLIAPAVEFCPNCLKKDASGKGNSICDNEKSIVTLYFMLEILPIDQDVPFGP